MAGLAVPAKSGTGDDAPKVEIAELVEMVLEV